MALNFVLGRAGSGKTRWCLSAAQKAMAGQPLGPPIILLVPEQATHQTERALLAGLPGVGTKAAVRARVLSFRRLAAAVLDSVGRPETEILDATGRHMVLSAVLQEVRPELHAFRASSRQAGFVGRLGATLSELAAQRTGSEALRAAQKTLAEGGASQLLQAKAGDLALVMDTYRSRLQEAYLDPQDILDLAADRVAASQLWHGAQVWVDGFAGFTPQEYELLMALARVAAEVWVALCLDPSDLDGQDGSLFAPTRKTYWQLHSAAAAAGVGVGKTARLPAAGQPVRFADAGPLGHLERHWDHPRTDAPAPPAGEAVKLVAAPDQRGEVAAAAAEMIRLCREEGYAWRDMAVIVSDMDVYHDLLRTTLADYGIPCFVDRRREVPHHPAVEFVRSALEVAAGNWPPEAVFRWLKTDLGPLGRDQVDELENYVLQHGLRGSAWTSDSPWRYWPASLTDDQTARAPSDDEVAARQAALTALDESRRKVAGLLGPTVLALTSAHKASLPTAQLIEALVEMLRRACVPEQVAVWAAEAAATGDGDGEQEHLQVWRGVCAVLEQAYAAMGHWPVDLAEFTAVLEAGLAALTLGLVPPSLDHVVCGTIERSRQPALKALFVLGAAQGAFPSAPPEDLVFDDRDRAALAKAGVVLAATARERSLHEEYFTYIALTRASERLWISWPAYTGTAEGPGPSSMIARLRAMFAGLEPRTTDGLDLACRPEQLVAGVAARFAGVRGGLIPSGEWQAAYDWLIGSPERLASHQASLGGWQWTNEARPLDAGTTRELWRSPIRGSASRLEQYMRCPFAHFASYGLALQVRPRQQVRAPEMGSFYHAVLQAFYQGLRREGLFLRDLAESEWAPRLDREIERIAGRLQSQVLLSSGRHRYLASILARTLRRTVRRLALHEERSAFSTMGVEVGFGLPGASHGPLMLGDISLRGIIDRLDAATSDDGTTVLRVIDYKSGRPAFAIADAAHGISLQLLTYLVAAEMIGRELGLVDAEVVALLLFPVTDPMVNVDGPDDERMRKKLDKAWEPAGLVLADVDVIRLMDAAADGSLLPVGINARGNVTGSGAVSREQLELLGRYLWVRAAEMARALLAGEIGIVPYRRGNRRACTYCDYHQLCAFDPQMAGNAYRELASLSKEEAWAQISLLADGKGARTS